MTAPAWADPPEFEPEDDLPEFDDYWLSWPWDTLAEQADPDA